MTAPSSYATAAIDELTQALAWLAASLLPGTAKPYRAPQMTTEARAARALEDRTYRLAAIMGGTIPLGESPAPMDLTVMDLLSEILTAADEMAEQVAVAAGVAKLAPARSAFADPGPYLDVVRVHLEVAIGRDDTIARYIEGKCDGLVFRAHNQLGLFGDGQVLKTVCPWCRGRTEHAVAGEHTMRVKAVLPVDPDDRPLRITDITNPDDIRWMIVCFGLNCEPPEKDCGRDNWWRGHPAWDLRNEGAWLAQRLEWASAS